MNAVVKEENSPNESNVSLAKRSADRYSLRHILARLSERANLRKVIANIWWLSFNNAAKLILGLFVGIWVARYLGPANYGVLNYAGSFVQIAAIVATLGLDGIVSRNVVRNNEKKEIIMNTAFAMKMISGVIAYLGLFLIMIYFYPTNTILRTVTMIYGASLLFKSLGVVKAWYDAQLQSKYFAYASLVSLLVASSIKIALIVRQASLPYFAFALMFDVVLANLLLALYFRIKGEMRLKWKMNIDLAISMLKDGAPLILSSMIVVFNMSVNKLMLGSYSTSSEVGVYSVAALMSGVFYFVVTALSVSVSPNLINKIKLGYDKYLIDLQKIYALLTSLAIIVALPISIFAQYIIKLTYGSAYMGAAPVLAVQIWSALFVFHVSMRKKAFIIENKSNLVMIYSFFTLLSNITFNMLLIPRYQALGASIAFLLSWAVSVLFLPIFSRRGSSQIIMFIKSFNPMVILRSG